MFPVNFQHAFNEMPYLQFTFALFCQSNFLSEVDQNKVHKFHILKLLFNTVDIQRKTNPLYGMIIHFIPYIVISYSKLYL